MYEFKIARLCNLVELLLVREADHRRMDMSCSIEDDEHHNSNRRIVESQPSQEEMASTMTGNAQPHCRQGLLEVMAGF
jgi:hypothetical protein